MKKGLKILTLLFGLVGTLLITLSTRTSPYVKHGLKSDGMAHAIVIVHPTWICIGIILIVLSFILAIINVLKNE